MKDTGVRERGDTREHLPPSRHLFKLFLHNCPVKKPIDSFLPHYRKEHEGSPT